MTVQLVKCSAVRQDASQNAIPDHRLVGFSGANAALRSNYCWRDFVVCPPVSHARLRKRRDANANRRVVHELPSLYVRFFRTGLDFFSLEVKRSLEHLLRQKFVRCITLQKSNYMQSIPTDCLQRTLEYLPSSGMIALNQTNHDLSERIVGPKVVPSALRGEYCPSLIPAACRAQLQARHSGRIPLTYIEYDWLKEIYAFYDESFAPWTEIRYLDLSEANLSDAALGKILSKFPNVIVLNLRGNSQVSDLRPLARLIALRDLDLRECEQLSDLAPLEALPSLHSLKLDNCPKVANLEPLQRLFSLRRLYFSATGVAHLAPIAGLIFLEYLELDHCPKILSAEFVYLEKLVLLEFLKTNVEITDHDFIFLAEFSSLKHLFLSNCSKVTNIGLSYLTQLGGLQILTIAQAGRITGVGLQHLAQIKSLQNLGIFGVPYIANAQLIRLARLPALTDLVIGRHGQMIQVDIDLLRSIGA